MTAVYVAAGLAILILFVLVTNSFINAKAKLTYPLDPGKVNKITLDRDYKEMLITVSWELKGFDFKIAPYEYVMRVNDSQEFKRNISKMDSSLSDPAAEVISGYTKDSEQFSIPNPKAGEYSFQSNNTDLPKGLKITETIQLFD